MITLHIHTVIKRKPFDLGKLYVPGKSKSRFTFRGPKNRNSRNIFLPCLDTSVRKFSSRCYRNIIDTVRESLPNARGKLIACSHAVIIKVFGNGRLGSIDIRDKLRVQLPLSNRLKSINVTSYIDLIFTCGFISGHTDSRAFCHLVNFFFVGSQIFFMNFPLIQ